MIAAWLLVAVIALIGSGLAGNAHAQAGSNVIPSINLDSNQPGQLVITWVTPNPAPTDYRIRWANTSMGFPSYSAANEPERGNEYPLGNVNTLTLSNLTPGDSYKVQIRSRYYNADRSVHESSGPWTSTTIQRVKDNPPAAPSGLTLSFVEHNSLTLTWNDPQDTNITGYRIQRGTDANSLHTIEPNTGGPSANYTDSTVVAETTYHYAVLAMSQDGNGARSITSVTTPAEPQSDETSEEQTEDDSTPAAPTSLTASQVTHENLTLTWNNPQDDTITGYQVLRGPDANNLATINSDTGSNATEYQDDTVEQETTYHYAVLAFSAAGDGPQSSTISATTPAEPKSKDPTPQRVAPRQAPTVTTFISNTGQTSGGGSNSTRATAFTTGAGTYTVSTVGIYVASDTGSPTPVVRIYEDNSGEPGTTLVATLTNPTLTASAVNVFTAPSNTTLSASKTYWLTTSNSAATSGQGFHVGTIANTTLDSGTAAGWSIGDARWKSVISNPWGTSSGRHRFQIRGTTTTGTGTDATLSALTVSPKDIIGFAADRTSYEVGVASTVTQATIVATKSDSDATVAYSTTDADATAADHQVDLSAGRNTVTVTVTAEDTTTTQTYTLSINRGVTADFGWKASDDFDGLITAENDLPRGMWSDETTMWVTDSTDDKIYAYDLATKARDASKDFNTLIAAGNDLPRGIWSNNITMWVVDYADDKIYAYNMTTKARDAGKDFDTAANPAGIWSDGTTMWVANQSPAKIYAYDMSTKARDADKDFDTLNAADNDDPGGIWSNNITMWVTDEQDGKIYAYNMTTKARDAGKDFNTLSAAGNGSVYGIWANANTMWVSDKTDDKIYSYNMPAITANTPAAGLPTISGPAHVEKTLTASTADISDTDGLPTAFNYQWKRVDDDGVSNPTNIGTDSATYTLTNSELGKKVIVEVSFTDNANNSEGPLASAAYPSTGTVRAADSTAPTVMSIERQDPTSSLTNSDSPTWRVTFSEAVKNVDGTDFTIAGTTADLTVTPVTDVTGGYDVTASGGDRTSLNDTITLAFAPGQNITDTADNTLTATTPTGTNDPTFELDNTVPTFVSGTANGVLIVLTFSEALDPDSLPPGSAFDISTDTRVTVNNVSIEGTMVTLTVTPAIIVDQTVDVNNNAYEGAGTVPLKDFADNEVQPAETVGSYRVTNETPIGPPASLRAEAGDGRVRLIWTDPAGISEFTINYQMRYVAGPSVPMETAWIDTTKFGILTTLVQGLANSTAYAFEVRAFRSSEVGATATVSATPLTTVCTTDLGDRRKVWSATMTVGSDVDSITGSTDGGYRRGSLGSLPQNSDSFMIGGASYTIKDIYTRVGGNGTRRQLFLTTVDSSRFSTAVKGALRFHWCSNSSGFADPNIRGYRVTDSNKADWSVYSTRELALSLPANHDATGKPVITGTALVGQTLTATTGDVADTDGLPPNASDFAWQWIRVVDTTSTPIQDETSSTYTLTQDDAGKQIKVVVSFTDSLSGVESRTSDAHPSSGTVPAYTGLTVTQREDWSYTFRTPDFNNLPGGGGQTTSVKITALPDKGSLTLENVPITSRDLPKTLDATKNMLIRLKYSPPTDGNGTPFTSFKFKVNESATEYTMTVNVTPVNDPVYGRVFITGPAQVGYYLTASTYSIGDRDGIPSTLNYQWKRYAADGITFEQNIGANSSTYRLTDREQGKKIKVEVSYIDGGGTREVRLSNAFPYIATQKVGEATFISTIGMAGDASHYFTTQDQGQVFTTGRNPNGYTVSSVVIISEDPQGDDFALKICEVDGSLHPTTVCTDLTAPGVFPAGPLVFTAPTGTTLESDRTNYMVVISSPGGNHVLLDSHVSDGYDSSTLTGFSIRNKLHFKNGTTWQELGHKESLRMAVLGTINP